MDSTAVPRMLMGGRPVVTVETATRVTVTCLGARYFTVSRVPSPWSSRQPGSVVLRSLHPV
eukprot:359572-Chlamydomonas_euryale.AAC.4